MSCDVLSVGALAAVLVISCISKLNVGLLGMAFAFVLVLIFGLDPGVLYKAFPVHLLTTLLGVTFLFTIALQNGTIEKIASFFIRMVRGRRGMIPVVFFLIAFGIPSIGPGPLETIAILAPPAMAVAGKTGISPILMGLAVACGVVGAGTSPVAVGGAFANQLIAPLHIGVNVWRLYVNQALAHTAIFIAAYFLFGGLKLWKKDETVVATLHAVSETLPGRTTGFQREHILTFIGMAVLIVCAFLKLDVGLTALAIGITLIVVKAGRQDAAIKSMPWNVILMVCGVTVLIGLMKTTGGINIFTEMMARISTPLNATFIIAFIPAVISIYSSTVGVVLPTFVPIIADLARAIGPDVDPKALLYSLWFGASVVDVSPLSTIGALVLAAATPDMDKIKLYRTLLAWGVSMSIVGSFLAWLLFGILKI